ncbi:MAG: 4Fe-4S dicluster domain-containing protein [Leptospiraceae bacterium]|nr:4Fe-4S dicluster domain-containing protein [Leptospiraceae bacterium]
MSDKQDFQAEKKAHWQSYELKDSDDLKELQDREFYSPPLSVLDKIRTEGYNRKTFLKLMGASVSMFSLNCLRKPVEKIVPYVESPDYIKPGHPNYYASTCGGCSAACGILVKTKDGRPLKIEGRNNHPINDGAVCGFGQASIFDLYDPDRARQPMEIKNGKAVKKDWASLDKVVKEGLTGGKVAMLTSPINSPSTMSIVNEFLGSVDGKLYEFNPTSVEEAIAKASEKSYGKAIVPNYKFDKAKVILSVDADFLGTWISPVEFAKKFSKNRKLKEGSTDINKFYAAESLPTVTGSNADLRVAIKPGEQRRFLFAVARALQDLGAGNVPDAVSSQSVDEYAKQLGVDASAINKIAGSLLAAKGESLVVAGGTQAQNSDAIDVQIAVNLLNSLLGNDGVTVDHKAFRSDRAGSNSDNLKQLEKDINAGEVGVLIVHDVNLVYQLTAMNWKELLSKVKLVVSVSDRLDETALASHWLAPVNHYLESWGDREPIKGLLNILQPTIRPLFGTRSLEDMLIQFAGGTLGGKANFYEYLKERYMAKVGGQFEWEKLLQKGFISENADGESGGRAFANGEVKKLSNPIEGLSLALYTNVAIGDGKGANNSLRQELPDPISKVTWDNYVAVAPALAKKLSVKTDDVVVVKTASAQKGMELPVLVQPAMHSEAVGIALGYGRTSVGKVGNGVGKNSYELAVYAKESDIPLQYGGIGVSLTKTGKTYKLATTQTHHMMNPAAVPGQKTPGGLMKPYDHERTLIVSTTVDKYAKEPSAGIPEPEIPKFSENGKKIPAKGLNPGVEYPGNRWGMSVDLTLCTGCSACVLACQVENNIPVVGISEVRRGREMHWIRIDRYYIGDPEKPETLEIAHQPVMCQHCEDAPCETVCPVAATVHGSEGTNDMVYNRCVGTRYCLNNCPYKVRRFNWMEHWKNTDATSAPRYLGLNPEVTVRSRGVMEKCSFCSARVAEKKIKAKNEGRELKDGEIKTACQQTCPTDAITFGNSNDKNSQVSKDFANKRSYRILEVLNVKPQVAYMTRVRNNS